MSGLHADFRVERPEGFSLDVALDVEPMCTTALLGPNGAGKSTVVAALAGLLPIDEGRIQLGDIVLADPTNGVLVPPEDRGVGVVFQDDLLFPHMTVAENVAFGMRRPGVDRASTRARAREWLGRVGLVAMADRRPGELSGGEAQRVALARALAAEPKMLLLDEPMTGLDVSVRAEMRRLLEQHLASFEGPRILITHDPTEAFLMADEVYVLEDGLLTQHGTPDEIRMAPRTRYVADLAGINLIHGVASGASVDSSGYVLHVADEDWEGPVVVTIHPTAISVHAERPGGSPRNVWQTTIERVEQVGNRVRLEAGAPLRLTVEVTADARHELGLEPGASVWLAVKATEIGVRPAGS